VRDDPSPSYLTGCEGDAPFRGDIEIMPRADPREGNYALRVVGL